MEKIVELKQKFEELKVFKGKSNNIFVYGELDALFKDYEHLNNKQQEYIKVIEILLQSIINDINQS